MVLARRRTELIYIHNSAPDFSSGVIFKLMSFTFAMITLPIGTYFFTNAYVFKGALQPSPPPHASCLISRLSNTHIFPAFCVG